MPERGLGGPDHLDLEVDADLLADEQAAALEDLVPGQPEGLAVQLGAGREGGPAAAPGVVLEPLEADVEGHRAAGPPDGQVAVDLPAAAVPGHPGAAEVDGGVGGDVEEI